MALVGGLLALLVILISAAVNARYGMSLAREGFDQQVMMGVAIFADLGKAVAWVFLLGAIAKRQVMSSLAALVVFAACLTYAVGGSVGYVASLRAQSSAAVVDKAKEAEGVDAALRRKQQERDKLGTVTAPSVVKKQIEAKRQDGRYLSSERCTKATAVASRTFCTELAELEGDEQKAVEAERLDKELAALSVQRASYRGTAKVEKGDYQGAFIAHMTQWDGSNIQLGLALLFVIVVEGGACFMLGLALNHWTSTAAARRLDAAAIGKELPIGDSLGSREITAGDSQKPKDIAVGACPRGSSIEAVGLCPRATSIMVVETVAVPVDTRRLIEANAERVEPEKVPTAATPATAAEPTVEAPQHGLGDAHDDAPKAAMPEPVVIARPRSKPVLVPVRAGARPEDFVAFASERLEIGRGSVMEAELTAAYEQWCTRTQRQVLEAERLDRVVAQMCKELSIERDAGELTGVRLKPTRRRA